MKKLLSILLSVLVAVAALNGSIVAFSEDKTVGESGNYRITYNAERKELTVSGSGALYYEADSYPADLFSGEYSKAESVVIQEGITVICRYDFEDFESLRSVTLPKSLVRINPHSFRKCNKINEINFAGTAEQWKEIAISRRDNGGLSSAKINYNAEVAASEGFDKEYGIVKGVDGITYDFETAVLSVKQNGAVNSEFIYSDSFSLNNDGRNSFCVTGLEISEGATALGKDMMSGCYDLEYVNIPRSVKYVRKGCFSDCDALKDVYFAGSKAEWKRINIEKTGNDDLLDANVHFAIEEEFSNVPVYVGIGVVAVFGIGLVLVVTRRRN